MNSGEFKVRLGILLTVALVTSASAWAEPVSLREFSIAQKYGPTNATLYSQSKEQVEIVSQEFVRAYQDQEYSKARGLYLAAMMHSKNTYSMMEPLTLMTIATGPMFSGFFIHQMLEGYLPPGVDLGMAGIILTDINSIFLLVGGRKLTDRFFKHRYQKKLWQQFVSSVEKSLDLEFSEVFQKLELTAKNCEDFLRHWRAVENEESSGPLFGN